MNLLRRTFLRIGVLFRKRQLEADMAEEMRLHLEHRIQESITAGMSPEEARYAALRKFGGVDQVKERCREERPGVWLELFGKDFRFATRSLAKSPGFTAAVVGTLAIGIGATTAMVAVVRQALFPMPPFPEASRVVAIDEFDRQRNSRLAEFAPRYAQVRSRATGFAQVAATRSEAMNLVVNSEPEAAQVAWVTPDFFRVFGVGAEHGRTFRADEHVAGEAAGAAAVLSHDLWRRRFGGDPAVIGRDVEIGGKLRRVVGVMPKSFRQPPGFALWEVFLPLSEDALAKAGWMQNLIWMAGRLKAGVTPQQAEAEIAAMGSPEPDKPGLWSSLVPRVTPISERYQPDAPRLFWVFLGAVGFLHAIAVVNAINLSLVRVVTRRRELGIRLALGGSRGQLVRLLLVESLLHCALAGVAGVAMAWGGMTIVGPWIAGWLPGGRGLLSVFDGPSLAMAIGNMVVTSVLLAVVPAWRVARSDVHDVLKEGAGSLGDSRRLRRLRAALVIAQGALAVVLLAGGGLMIRSFVALQRTGLGFDPARKIAVVGTLPMGTLSADAFIDLGRRATEELGRVPGVRMAAQADVVPMSGASSQGQVRVADQPDAQPIFCSSNAISPDYFDLLGLSFRAGRGFADMRRGDPPVVVINEVLARRCFPGENPLGRRLEFAGLPKVEIVGVVADVRERGPRSEASPQCYVPFWQRPSHSTYLLTVLLRLEDHAPAEFETLIRRAAFAVDPRWVIRLQPLEEGAAYTVRVEQTTLRLLLVFSGFALVLAALGLFAVMAYSVSQQRREFGVRLALGATPGDLLRSVLTGGLRLALAGIALGLGAAAGLTRVLKSVLFETDSHDPATYALVAALLLAVALLASWLPARRAAKIDPIVALRAE